jgi:hypothetical protein
MKARDKADISRAPAVKTGSTTLLSVSISFSPQE